MNLILSTFIDYILPILVLFIGGAIAFAIFIIGKKKFKSNKEKTFRAVDEKDISVSPAGVYVNESVMKFLDYLHMALPQEFIAFPKVGVDQLVVPGKNRLAYNAIMSKYVDVVVFYRKTMEPVLIVDLIDTNAGVESAKLMDRDVAAVLKAIKLNIVEVRLEKAYNIETLRHQLIHKIPDKILAEINMNIKK